MDSLYIILLNWFMTLFGPILLVYVIGLTDHPVSYQEYNEEKPKTQKPIRQPRLPKKYKIKAPIKPLKKKKKDYPHKSNNYINELRAIDQYQNYHCFAVPFTTYPLDNTSGQTIRLGNTTPIVTFESQNDEEQSLEQQLRISGIIRRQHPMNLTVHAESSTNRNNLETTENLVAQTLDGEISQLSSSRSELLSHNLNDTCSNSHNRSSHIGSLSENNLSEAEAPHISEDRIMVPEGLLPSPTQRTCAKAAVPSQTSTKSRTSQNVSEKRYGNSTNFSGKVRNVEALDIPQSEPMVSIKKMRPAEKRTNSKVKMKPDRLFKEYSLDCVEDIQIEGTADQSAIQADSAMQQRSNISPVDHTIPMARGKENQSANQKIQRPKPVVNSKRNGDTEKRLDDKIMTTKNGLRNEKNPETDEDLQKSTPELFNNRQDFAMQPTSNVTTDNALIAMAETGNLDQRIVMTEAGNLDQRIAVNRRESTSISDERTIQENETFVDLWMDSI